MKKLLIFLWGVLIAPSLFGQKDSLDCDTIILGNGRVMLVHLDSVGEDRIFYRKCRKGATAGLQIAMSIVREVHFAEGGQVPGVPLSLRGRFSAPGQSESYWIFRNRIKKSLVYKIPDGAPVRLHIKTGKKTFDIVEGHLLGVDDSLVRIGLPSGGYGDIDKFSVLKLETNIQKWPGRGLRILLIVLLAILGGVLVGLTMLGALAGGGLWTAGFVPGLLALLLAIILGVSGGNPKISDPFRGNWEVVSPNGMVSDPVREILRQP